MKQSGENSRLHETVSLVGVRKNQMADEILAEIGDKLVKLVDILHPAGGRQKQNAAGGTAAVEKLDWDEKIDNFVQEHFRHPVAMCTKRTSSFKDLLGSCTRLLVGEVVAATLKQVDAQYVGCNDELIAEGLKVLSKRDTLVSRSTAVSSQSNGSRSGSQRANACDVLRSVMTMTCRKALGWKCKAAWTSFVCTLVFSILQGELSCEWPDTWKLSCATGKKRQSTQRGGALEGSESGQEGGTEVEAEAEKLDENQFDPKAGKWEGKRAFLKGLSVEFGHAMVTNILKIFREGGFWLLLHAHTEFEDDTLRMSKERGSCMLTKQVFTGVARAKLPSGQGFPEYCNFWTDPENTNFVKSFFRDPRAHPGIGVRWIAVDAHFGAQAFSFTMGNILKDLQGSQGFGPESEEYARVYEKGMNICDFVQILAPPLDETSTSETQVVSGTVRTKGKVCGKPRAKNVSSESASETALPPVSLPSAQQSEFFGRSLYDKECKLCRFVCVVEPCYRKLITNSEAVPIAKVFAVFSFQDGTTEKKPSVVFPTVVKVEKGRAQYTLQHSAIVFNERMVSPGFWTVLRQDEVAQSLRTDNVQKCFWFVGDTMQTAVVGILSSKTCRQKWKEGEAVDDVFGQGCSKSGCMPFLYDTPNVLKSVKFAEAVCPARLAVEQALALHTDTDSLGTSSSPNWEEAVLERTNKMDVKTMIRGLAVAETESALAFHADLLNVGDLSRKNFSNGEVFSQLGGAVCICTVRIDLSRNEFSSVQLHAPSWHKGFRCTEDSRFIVFVGKEDCPEECSLLTVVPKVDLLESVPPRRSVLSGRNVMELLPMLWDRIKNASNAVQFCPGVPPSRFLTKLREFETIQEYCTVQHLVSAFVTRDGNCLYSAMGVVAGILPCPPEAKKNLSVWATRYAPVIQHLRSMTAAAIWAVWEACLNEFRTEELALEKLFGRCPSYDMRRFKQVVVDDPQYLWRCGSWSGDLEVAALAWLVRVNVNVLSQDEAVARCLQEAKVRVFHMDSSRTERVHLTGQFPPSDTRPSNGILPVFNGFVTVDVKPRDGESCPGYYDIFGLFSRDHDVPEMTMAEGVARGWLDARFCRADSESLQSVFLFFGNNHYDALLPCPKNPVSITRTSTGGDVISHRLNGGKSPPVVLHLLPMALTCFLEKDTSTKLHAVYCCSDNDSISVVHQKMKPWVGVLSVDDLCTDNMDQLHATSTRLTRSCSKGASELPDASSQGLRGGSLATSHQKKTSGTSRKGARQESVAKGGKEKPNSKPKPAAHMANLGKEKLRKDTKIVVQVDRASVCAKSSALSSTVSEGDRRVLNSVMTMLCDEFRKMAKGNNCMASLHFFGALNTMKVPSPGKQHKVAMTVDNDFVPLTPQSTEPGVIKHDGAMVFLEKFVTFRRLVKEICSPNSSACDDFVRACALFRLTCKKARESCPMHNEVWEAAFYVQDKEQFKKTHGDLPLPIKGIVVPASKTQSCGTDDSHGFLREKPAQQHYPELLVYPSLRGGLGVFTLGSLRKHVYVTEYGGRLVSNAEAQELKKLGLHTHMRTLFSMFLELDGRRTDEFTVEHYAQHGMVSF